MEITDTQKQELDELGKLAFSQLENYRLACKRIFPEEESLKTIHCQLSTGETFVYTKGKNKSKFWSFGSNLFARNNEVKPMKLADKETE